MISKSALIPILLILAAGCGRTATSQEVPEGSGMSANANDTTEHRHTNRLAKEESPYLLQHAHNPVDWYPWGDEAFKKAKDEDKPIFLSIGYSTCHWCHVMERESFEDEAIAAVMNEHFVCIKVDREERPDIDNIYMAAVQAMTGSGGWPLSVALTPDGGPFWGGTYFPPVDGFGRPGFKTVLNSLAEAWNTRRADVVGSAEKITAHIRQAAETRDAGEPTEATLAKGYSQFSDRFDARHGGFETAPKFPRSHALSFLLRMHNRGGENADRALMMVEKTLVEMWRGGIYDHLDGGFHRYSTDPVWLVPHFEKMLYDQAMLSRSYLEAYQITGNELYADIARDIFRYVLSDMTDEQGGFYSAEDADAEGVEGKFNVWSHDEILEVLGEEDGALFAKVYGASKSGNFREEASGEATGMNILHLPRPLEDIAGDEGTDRASLTAKLAPMREKLAAVREKRIHPLKDDKVLTDWNGLMIASLAYGGRVLGEQEYTDAAAKAAGFLLKTMVVKGRLLHRYRGGSAAIPAFLDDHAFLIHGLVELYEATFDPTWLAEAKNVAGEMVRLFKDSEGGGFLFSGSDGEDLVTETKELYDGAIPSGNSVAMLALLRVGRLTGDSDLEAEGRKTIAAFGGMIDTFPMGYPFAAMALDWAIGPTREVVFAGDPADPELEAMIRTVNRRFSPRTAIALHPPGTMGEAARDVMPFLDGKLPIEGRAATYVCRDFACREPVTTVPTLTEILDE